MTKGITKPIPVCVEVWEVLPSFDTASLIKITAQ